MDQPNILLIVVDEMRGDCLVVAGHPDVKTPYLDTLAVQGVRFECAYSATPSCIPARAALMTGLTQDGHGRYGYRDRVHWDYPHTMPGELTSAGYQTQCVGKMHVHPLRSLQGFMNIELHDGYLHSYRDHSVPYYENQKIADDYFHFLKQNLGIDADVTDTGLECNSWVARPWIYEEKYHPTNWATDRSIDFLRRRDRDKPFFLMTSYVRPHAPYDAPQVYFDMYKDKKLRPPFVGDWADRDALERNARIYNNSTGPADPQLVHDQMVGYYACITHLDHQIGRLINALTDDGCLRDTLIVFTSDHGELLSDHHLVRKSRAYRGSTNIPLIISGRGVKRGIVSDTLAELRDIMPTLLDAAGVEIPECVEGMSLWPECAASDEPCGAIAEREYIHGEHEAGDLSSHWIVTQSDKYIRYSKSGTERYFDLKADPHELTDKINAPEYRERIDYLRQLLKDELSKR